MSRQRDGSAVMTTAPGVDASFAAAFPASAPGCFAGMASLPLVSSASCETPRNTALPSLPSAPIFAPCATFALPCRAEGERSFTRRGKAPVALSKDPLQPTFSHRVALYVTVGGVVNLFSFYEQRLSSYVVYKSFRHIKQILRINTRSKLARIDTFWGVFSYVRSKTTRRRPVDGGIPVFASIRPTRRAAGLVGIAACIGPRSAMD